jgi:hypothetical protein
MSYHTHLNTHSPHKRSVEFLCRRTIVRRSSGLYGGKGGPDYPGVRTNDGKLSGIGSMQNISTHCYSGTPESRNIVPNIIIIIIIIISTSVIPPVPVAARSKA